MKTKVLLAAVLLVGLAASAQAAGTIVGSKHDLASVGSNAKTGSIHSTSQNQTCVFCHAPHNAITNKLLWNRNYVAGATMKIYTSYNTAGMRAALGASNNSLGDDSSSLLCLSCHSITTANVATVVTNTANTKGGVDSGGAGAWATRTGNMTNLTNDHPVGIGYDLAIPQSSGGLQPVATVTGAGLRLFKSTAGGNNTMECASCHSVHDNTYPPFLVKSNNNSALCIVCHIK
ncbi:MAG: cytochrome c3 family protein [Desulfuromonadales bacterium]